jgi:signal transduction histidine kinase/ligand-binding sensor domain-containing protein
METRVRLISVQFVARFFGACWFCAGLLPEARAHPDFSIVVHGTDDHAPRRDVAGIAESRDGFLWVASANGLSRFDGLRFITLPSERGQRNSQVIGDLFGGAWIRHPDQSLWKWSDGRFARVAIPPEPAQVSWLFGQADGSALLLDTRGRLYGCRGGEMPRDLECPILEGNTVAPDPTGGAWFCKNPASLGRITADGKATMQSLSSPLFAAAPDGQGGAWAVTQGGLLHCLNGQTTASPLPPLTGKNWRLVGAPHGDALWFVNDHEAWYFDGKEWAGPVGPWVEKASLAVATADRALWVSLEPSGLLRLAPTGERVALHSADGLPALAVERLFEDRLGGMWVALRRGGLAVVRPRRFLALAEAQGLPGALAWTLAEDAEGAVWVGTEETGLARWQGEGFIKDEPAAEPPPAEATFSLALCTDGTFWAAGRKKVFQRVDGKWRDAEWELPPKDEVLALAPARDGGLWLAANFSGLWHKPPGATTITRVTEWVPNAPRGNGNALIEDAQGRVWAGRGGGNIECWDGKSIKLLTNEPNGPGNSAVYALESLEDGTVWLATVGGGLLRWRDGHFTRYGQAQGLPDERVVSVVDDGHGFLWVGTRAGLARIRLGSFAEVDAGTRGALDLAVFQPADGLPTGQFIGGQTRPALRAKDGRLWFATSAGVVVCDPRRFVLNTLPPSVVIEDVRLNDKPALRPASEFAAFPVPAPPQLEVPPGPNLLEIGYTAPCLAAAEKVRFQHRLEGVDANWVEAGSRREVRYAALSPGTYHFAVRAANNDGVWCETPASFAIVVHPYWWQRRGMQAGFGLAIAVAAGAASWAFARRRHHSRLAQLEVAHATEQERARIAQDLHDDLGAALTEISMLATTAERSRAAAPLVAIGDKSRGLVEALDSIVWSVNPDYDSVASFVDYATGFARDFLGTARLACRLDIAPDLPALGLAARPRHQLFLALKEALNNVVRHAAATEVRLRMAVEPDGRFVLMIEDNGRGFDPEHPAVGMGLGGMRARLLSLHGTCELHSQPGVGTTVRLALPIS